jgi:hypothetical protein
MAIEPSQAISFPFSINVIAIVIGTHCFYCLIITVVFT